MQIEWRTVQFFLEDDLVCEVEVDSLERKKVRCNCPVFRKDGKCKHSKHVRLKMAEHDGHYPISVTSEGSLEMAQAAMSSAEEFREFLIHFAKTEVI